MRVSAIVFLLLTGAAAAEEPPPVRIAACDAAYPLAVRGRAGERLVFRASATGEVWELVGEDEVRRAG